MLVILFLLVKQEAFNLISAITVLGKEGCLWEWCKADTLCTAELNGPAVPACFDRRVWNRPEGTRITLLRYVSGGAVFL
jgi:hypothetical protein